MYLKTMIAVSVAILAIGLFMKPDSDYSVLLQFSICASAVLIVLHSLRAKAEYFWAGAFCCVALLFNPIVPVVPPGGEPFWLDIACITLFLVYYRVYRVKPRVSLASIADNSPRPRALAATRPSLHSEGVLAHGGVPKWSRTWRQ
jgi:hypothetical protein